MNTTLLSVDKDPMGTAIANYYKRHKAERLRVFSSQFDEDEIPVKELFRMEKQMPLQIDATVQYALGRQKEELTIADTKIDSPYNTYERQGLPPGPISSPGMDAVRAVLDAAPGEYLYYVAEKDGRHVFTKTLEEHQAEIDRIYGTDD